MCPIQPVPLASGLGASLSFETKSRKTWQLWGFPRGESLICWGVAAGNKEQNPPCCSTMSGGLISKKVSKNNDLKKNLLKMMKVSESKDFGGFWDPHSLYQASKQTGLPKILYLSFLKINSAQSAPLDQESKLPMEWSPSPLTPQKNVPFFELTWPATPHFGQVPTSLVGDQRHSVSEKLPPRILGETRNSP